ncbi:MAG TPA: hypothetical protein VLZ72_01605, partial [Flavobacterium sp.]|nr:hypothetical protein [Flavobacterium sp.]
EPRRIVHPLEENQTNVVDLTQQNHAQVSLKTDAPIETPESKIVFELIDELEVIEPKVVTDLIATTEVLKNIEVSFEIVSPQAENSLFTITPEIREIIVKEPEFVIVEKEKPLFEIELSEELQPELKNENPVNIEVTANDIKVNEPVQVIPVTELNETGVVHYSLEDYLEVEKGLLDSTNPVAEQKVNEPVEEDMNITVKQLESETKFDTAFDEIDPMEMSIEETLRMRANERRKKLKDFNYKFHNNSRIDELEKTPAYKRAGTSLNQPQTTGGQSRMSLGTDSNNDPQLRNNSFLHDNVD